MTMTGSLPKTHKVYLSDRRLNNLDYDRARLHLIDAAIWATKNCTSFKQFNIANVYVETPLREQIATYEFSNKQDAMWFTLRWIQ